jgi:hypothetical protein
MDLLDLNVVAGMVAMLSGVVSEQMILALLYFLCASRSMDATQFTIITVWYLLALFVKNARKAAK